MYASGLQSHVIAACSFDRAPRAMRNTPSTVGKYPDPMRIAVPNGYSRTTTIAPDEEKNQLGEEVLITARVRFHSMRSLCL